MYFPAKQEYYFLSAKVEIVDFMSDPKTGDVDCLAEQCSINVKIMPINLNASALI